MTSSAAPMHADEAATDPALVRRLLAGQFPRWAGLPVRRVASYGTDHAIYRLGDALSVRLPRIDGPARQAALEGTWLPRLAPHLPLALPVQRAMGHPAEGYPYAWSVYDWLPGESAATAQDLDPARAAADLAAFVVALRAVGTAGAPSPGRGARGGPIAALDGPVRRAVTLLGDRIDGAAALRSWEESLAAPPHHGPGQWLHGDLLPGNLLVVGGRLTAVIDFGTLTVGDPAVDLLPAWNLFTGPSRDRFRAALAEADGEADAGAWLRGRGWALAQAVIALPYYWDTNPGMVRQASRAVREVLSEPPGATASP